MKALLNEAARADERFVSPLPFPGPCNVRRRPAVALPEAVNPRDSYEVASIRVREQLRGDDLEARR